MILTEKYASSESTLKNPLENRFHGSPYSLEQKVPSEARRVVFGIKIRHFEFKEDYAQCRARIDFGQGPKWVSIHLDKKSLEACDLREGDYFEWVPREDGIVKDEDITQHPRRVSLEEVREACEIFKQLRKKFQK